MTSLLEGERAKSPSQISDKCKTISSVKESILMSTNVREMYKVTVKQDSVVAKKMNQVVTVLEENYGVKAIPLIDSAHDECQLVLQQIGKPVGTIYYYDVADMLEVDAEKEAAHLAEFLATRATKRPKG